MSSFLQDSIRVSNNRSAYLRETGADVGSVNWLDAEAKMKQRQQQEAEVQQQQEAQKAEEAKAQPVTPYGRPKMDNGQVVQNPDGSTQMEANVGGMGGYLAATKTGQLLKQAETEQATNPFYQSQIDRKKRIASPLRQHSI